MAPNGVPVVVLVGLLVVALLYSVPSPVVAAAAATQQQHLTGSEAGWATPAGAEGSTAGVGDSKQVRRCRCCWFQRGICYRYCCLNGQVIPAHDAAAKPGGGPRN